MGEKMFLLTHSVSVAIFSLLYVFLLFFFIFHNINFSFFLLAVKFFASHYTIHSFHSTQQTLVLRLCWLALA